MSFGKRLSLLSNSLVVAGLLVGCGGGEPAGQPPAPTELLAPPAEGEGIQLKMVTTLEPGVEAEHCMFVKGPAEGMYIQHDEVRFTKGSHHFLLYETNYTDIPTAKLDGTKVDTSGVFDCSDGPTNGWDVKKLVAGSQNAEGTSMVDFPDGVAMKVRPNAVLMMNAHYINASAATAEPEVRINLYTVPEAKVVTEGDILFLYNPFIHVGPNSSRSARMRCPVHTDITIQNLQSHMHARGVGYEAFIAGQAAPMYTSTQWEGVPVQDYGAGIKVSAGSWFDYHCDYKNSEARDVFQGPRSTDEMCMLIGSYYPANQATANCQEDPLLPPEQNFIGGEWVGDGSATCAATLGCIQQGLGTGFEEVVKCVTASDATVSKEMSSAVRCIFKSLNAGKDPMTVCSAEINTCLAK